MTQTHNIRDTLSDQLKVSMRSRDRTAISTIRLILAALKDRDIEARAKGQEDGIEDNKILSLLQTMVKQRHESITLYKKGNREDLAKEEQAEIEVIHQFLPKQLEDKEMEQAVLTTIKDTGAKTIKDMGKVMASLRENYPGRMDFGAAGALVKNALAKS